MLNRLLCTITVFALCNLPAYAECTCACVDGEYQALCESTVDLEPICGGRLCPLDEPSLPPLKSLELPPLGTTKCRQARVSDGTGAYQWQTVCR